MSNTNRRKYETMATYLKSITIGPVPGGLRLSPEKVDELVNGVLENIQHQNGEITDVKVNLAELTPGGYVTTYVILYDAPRLIA
jgi:hypothetical protein